MENNKNYSANSYEAILREASQTKTKVNSFSKTYPAFIVLLIFIALAFYVRSTVKENTENQSKATFDKAVNSVMLRLENKYNSNLQVLTSIQGLYDQYVEVVRDYFKLYSSVPTSTNASIKSLMYVPKLNASEVGNHVFNMQRQGLWEYNIHPASTGNIIYPVEFIEPFEKNIKHSGYDFMSSPDDKTAIEKARDNNIITATQVSKTINMENGGFYIFAPVYKQNSNRDSKEARNANYNGVVVEEIDANRFILDALGGNFPSDTSIVFQLFDGKSLIYKSSNYDKYNADDLKDFNSTEILNIADRQIEVKFSTIPNFRDWLTRNLHNILFLITLILAILFFLFIYSVTTSRARALDLAERMTRSQRRILESSKDIISVLDLQGNWKSINPATELIFNLNSEQLIGKSISELFLNPQDFENLQKQVLAITNEDTISDDYEMKSINNPDKWISWNLTVSKPDGLVYAVGRDVTLEKLAEKEAILKSKQMELAGQYTREASEFKSYFMTKLSHQMRNSLTGIVGYLQLLNMKLYENEEEQMSFISLAEESSEELFTFVSDLVDVADTAADVRTRIDSLIVKDLITKSINKYKAEHETAPEITTTFLDEGEFPAKVIVDSNYIDKAMQKILYAITQGVEKSDLQIAATENTYEGATEIQMMTDGNALVSEMIGIYKANTNNIIPNLNRDKNDILLNLAIASSVIKMMNGTMSVETFGPTEGNVIQITLPINKKTK